MPVKPEPYDDGDELDLDALFTDALDAPKDPTGVSITLDTPNGTVVVWTYAAAEVVRVSTGLYRRVYTVDVAAHGWGRFKVTPRGTGALAISRPRWFTVRNPNG